MTQLAHWISQYAVVVTALAVFCAMGAGYGIAGWAGHGEAYLSERHRSAAAQSGVASLTPRARGVLIVWAIAGLAVFVAVVYALAVPGELDRFDHALAGGLADSMSHGFLSLVSLFTQVGDRTFLMGVGACVLVLLLWHKRWALACVWVAASAGGGTLNKVLKATFERVRPDLANGFMQAHGFSFPSGHATGAVAVYGVLAYILLRLTPLRYHRILFSLACGLIAAIGISRILLQVHFFSDVLAGLAVTTAWIAACILILEGFERRFSGPLRPPAD